MKIVMLGFTGVGKTTYMASLYGALQRPVSGLSLKTNDSEDRRRLLKLADDVSQGKYPQPTSQKSEYKFQLMHEGKEVVSFIWSDYRGGALRETQNSDQARSLVQDLRQADGIMIFCDCDALSSNNTRKNQLDRMVALIGNALQKVEKNLSLAIVLTKCDLLKNFSTDMLDPFRGLVAAIEANDLIHGAFIPVACGRKMVNVPIPLLFALHTEPLSQPAKKNILISKHERQAKDWEEKSKGMWGGVRWAFDKVVGNPTDKELAESNRLNASKYHKEYREAVKTAESLDGVIKKLPLIRKGTTLKEYQQQIQKTRHGIGFDQIPGINGYSPLDPFKAFN